ncbi:oxidase ustYa family protein [Aspergillus vadensis CBS 113365]|uniref:Tat pathway signal sequence n=1 Tax=Aspergillus vadensis (strain CBS 113365 / IMI 142717 / IBT 24658) TaxID=1448311 RepID=A0A319AT76_ASPVC|nr:hypothetical protein BO88DRAFT_353118 [Aspergillus vadensis CBS 113365]PYH63537.1 hypothetical protein BO88DRAFT_353118 [Aspergillus vadensis CBS 113365]
MHSPPEYYPLSSDESKRLTGDEVDDQVLPHARKPYPCIWFLHIMIFSLCICIAVSGWIWHPVPTDLDCAKKLSPYSPLVGLVEYEDVRFQGDLHDVNPWKGAPSPALDEAWENITHISADDMLRMKKPLTQVKAPPALGDGYVGGIEVFHQLHCLNLVRQYTYYDYYMQPENQPLSFRSSPGMIRAHTADHCIDILRQVVQCNGDAGVLTRSWVKGNNKSQPDFGTWHKCRKIQPL